MHVKRSARRIVTRRSGTVLGLALALAVLCSPPATAAGPGDLDTSFDYDGRVIADVFGGSHDEGYDVAVQRDGKIVVVGSRGSTSSRYNFALMRFHPDGSVDPTFASNGRTLTDFDGDDDVARAVKIQSDGKIVVAGSVRLGNRESDFGIARYNPDGKLDPTFAGNGKAATDFGARDELMDLAIQRDGKIVTVGFTDYGADTCEADFAVARWNTNGTLDKTFSGDGKTRTGMGCGEFADAVAIQPDGRIVVVGVRWEDDGDRCFACNETDLAIARYNTNGTLDSTFDGDGKKTEGLGGVIEDFSAVAIQSDGKILAAGTSDARDREFFLERMNPNGSLDQTFFQKGRKWADMGGRDEALDMVVQSDGKIVVAGVTYSYADKAYDFAVLRLRADGVNDTSFSGDGVVVTPFAKSQVARAMALQPDGRIVVAGTMSADGDADAEFAIARYLR